MKKLKINNEVYDRFVDDITILPTVIQQGMKLENDKLVYCENKFLEDITKPSDLTTMNIIQQVADRIDPNIKVTYDIPSLNNDGFVPIFDLKVR